MKVRYDVAAASELRVAVEYYEALSEGLGAAFEAEVRKAIQLVIQFPNGWPLLVGGTRRIRLNRFPFGIVYTAAEQDLYIVAIMHLHRMPGYWSGRRR